MSDTLTSEGISKENVFKVFNWSVNGFYTTLGTLAGEAKGGVVANLKETRKVRGRVFNQRFL